MSVFLALAKDRHRYDFLIVAALDEERRAYLHLTGKVEIVIRKDMVFWDFTHGGKRGTIVCLPRMGLVNATAVTATLLEHYSPSVMCLSGICGGIGNDVHLGQLLITDICWEYQSGK